MQVTSGPIRVCGLRRGRRGYHLDVGVDEFVVLRGKSFDPKNPPRLALPGVFKSREKAESAITRHQCGSLLGHKPGPREVLRRFEANLGDLALGVYHELQEMGHQPHRAMLIMRVAGPRRAAAVGAWVITCATECATDHRDLVVSAIRGLLAMPFRKDRTSYVLRCHKVIGDLGLPQLSNVTAEDLRIYFRGSLVALDETL